MKDLRKAAEMALEALCLTNNEIVPDDIEKQREAAITALRQALNDKPLVKSYCGGKPNYCTPVDGVNINDKCVHKTEKSVHEWVGLDGEIPGLGLVTEEFYNGMLFAEDYLREKNGG